MNRMIKIFIGIFCFIALFSCNNNDNISTAQVNSITTTTIDDDMATVEIRIHDAFATDGGVRRCKDALATAAIYAVCERI